MRAIVVYESMYGNTHEIAERIAAGLRPSFEVEVRPVGDAIGRVTEEVDLLVVGGPTHVHGMSRSATRKSAAEDAAKHADLDLEPGADGPGLREWFGGLPQQHRGLAAAFDTRIDGPEMFTGHASKGIAKQLSKHGLDILTDPESFLVDKHSHLVEGEAERAAEWGEALAARFALTRG